MTKPTILFVDDDTSVLRSLKRLFRKDGIDVLTASSGAEGLRLLEQHHVNVVVSDQRMPGMCGTDFLKEVRTRHAETVRCILSGYAEMESVVAAINDGNVYRFIAKPWDDTEIRKILGDCLSAAERLVEERRARVSLESRATALEEQSAQLSELFTLQESLLKSSRDVLDRLPVAVAALDACGRMIYTNRRFTNEFGHLPGATLGQPAGDPWADAANDNFIGNTEITVDDTSHIAQVEQIEIAGHMHTIIALSPHGS